MAFLRNLYLYILNQYESDKARALYWTPVFFALGIGWYFAQSTEPPVLVLGFGFLFAILGCVFAARVFSHRPIILVAAIMVAVCAGGALTAQIRTISVESRTLSEEIGPISITGTIESIDRTQDGGRVVMGNLEFESRRRIWAQLPDRVRLKIRHSVDDLNIGTRIRVLAMISPPNAPAVPGGYDFARQIYFDRIGAVGFAMGPPQIVASAQPDTAMMRINQLRDTIIQKVLGHLTGDTAAVSAALITSEQSGVSPDAMQDLRRSGLQHVLSVSGLHLTLFGGFVFLFLRLLLMWAPGLTVLSKKIAAIGGIAATFFYLTISGFEVPTIRAFVMVALVFLAVLIDREALSMRLVAVAAIAILFLFPESLLHVSFQLSFAAVAALIAVYESWRLNTTERKSWPRLALEYLFLSAATSFIASIATAPLIAYHFHQLTLQGILSNTLVGPLVSFWIMPLVVICLMAMPAGLEQLPLWLLGQGVDAMLAVAKFASQLPGALIMIPAISDVSVLLMVFGGLWLMVWRKQWRYWGIAPVAMGLMLSLRIALPDVLINQDAGLIGVKTAHDSIALSSLKKDKFTAGIWNNYFGQSQSVDWNDPENWVAEKRDLRCDRSACIYKVSGHTVSIVLKNDAFAEDCQTSDVIITALRAPESCAAKNIFDKYYFRANGNSALWFDHGVWRMQSVAEMRGKRPWTGGSDRERREDDYIKTPAERD